MPNEQRPHLVWFRNDLRTHDHPALHHACQSGEGVLAVYCFDPRQFALDAFGFPKTGKFRAQFLWQTVQNLQENLQNLGITLLVYHQHPEAVIPKICQDYGVKHLYFQEEWTPEEKAAEQAVRQALPKKLAMYRFYQQFLIPPPDLPMPIADLPRVFTHFRKQVEKKAQVQPPLPTPQMPVSNRLATNSTLPPPENLGFRPFAPHPLSAFPFSGGETAALERLEDYFFRTQNLAEYKKTRNGLIGTDYSSKFSPWLANGSLSPRYIYAQVKAFEQRHVKNQSTYWLIFELLWRDFFKYISLKHGAQIFKLEGILNAQEPSRHAPEDLQKWMNGQTPEPFVNANMRELKHTGWMSNRGRQNVASYLAKNLQLDWRLGAAYFESLLLDYDVHSNYGNWVYVSGVGNDPRNRIFNVALQAQRYDADGAFRKLWGEE